MGLNKEMTTDQKEKMMKKFGQKFEKLENKGKYLHGLFHNMAMNGKMKIEDQKDMKKKMKEIKEMGDEKMEEIKQKKPASVVPSFTEITRKQHVTEFAELNQGPPAASVAPNAVKMSLNGEAGDYSMMTGPKRTEERQNPKTQKPKISTQDNTGKDREVTMKDLKANVSEISEKLFSFENEVKGNFMEKNLTSAQEEEMMMVLGKKGAMLEKKAKRLHEIFEDMEKREKKQKKENLKEKEKKKNLKEKEKKQKKKNLKEK